jgi:hypothetical protein
MNDQAQTGTGVAATEGQPRRQLAELNLNPFEQYGSQVSSRRIVGKLLKFNKGDYLAGEDEEEIEFGKKLVCNMDQLLVGWVKWVDNRPDQELMGLIVEGHQAPKRDSLGDLDESQWELDSTGKARDPWQFSNYLLMKEVGADGKDEDKLFTFATSSRGGLNAIGDLCKTYGKEMRMRPDEYPIVELGGGSYNHPNKEFGRIKFPTLKIVGWEPKSQFGAVEQAEAAES